MISLGSLVPEIDSSLPIFGITDDSRKVRSGDLLMAVSGQRYSANQMLKDVKHLGVAAVLCDSNESVDGGSIPLFRVEELAARRGEIASKFYGNPSHSLFVVAITGTNGKTSCSQFIAHAFDKRCGVIGTMGNGFMPNLKDAGLTTPDAISLQGMLASMLKDGASAVSIEASSHGLVQGRLNGVAINTAVFTNITRDHLDYHETFDAYKAAKKRLFEWPELETAVLNLDDEFSIELAESLDSKVLCLTYSLKNASADIYCTELSFSPSGIDASIETPWGGMVIHSSLIGDFNLSNLLAVIGVLGSAGLSIQEISQRISAIKNVPGRMEQFPLKKGAVVIIDYAHTPNALENALKAARVHCDGKLWCVMGCGGDRDKGKRPIMGEIASRLADITVVTDDNPRSEASESIIEQILAGVIPNSTVYTEADRAKAISLALSKSNAGDLVLIAGKGHETYQEIHGVRSSFSDLNEVARFDSAYRELALRNVVVGFGKTGMSVAAYCVQRGWPFAVTDDAAEPPRLTELNTHVPVEFAPIQRFEFLPSDRLFVSPGVPLTHPDVQRAKALGAVLTNDIQVFSELCERPLAMITGSNGKSTVTNFVGQLMAMSGRNVGVGGNIGTPALDLLDQGFDAHVIEVSSYQLELADHCSADVAVLLNLSPDHLDRYDSLHAYYAAKANVFAGCTTAVINRTIELDVAFGQNVNVISFGFDEPSKDSEYGLLERDGNRYLARGSEILFDVRQLPVPGRHNWLNVLAALATAEAMGVTMDKLIIGIENLTGLPHRCESVSQVGRLIAINDSKSTNPASTVTAIEGFAEPGREMTLLLGGLGKDADFTVLAPALQAHVTECYVYGEDRDLIASQIGFPAISLETLDDCMRAIASHKASVDLLLFSPACASLDQFENFEERGRQFKVLAQELFK
jgi:UDP-N-acetylmuramoyl-L-alanyl-D-glutamate--2,6-diaminopimelate ligase